MAYSGPLVQLEVSFTRLPWRIAPGWAVAAGAIAGGLSFAGLSGVLKVAGAIVLADVAWGMLRHYTAHPAPPDRAPGLLPYATATAPLARVLAALTVPGREDQPGWQGWVVGLLLTGVLSIALGWQAVVLSLVALALVWTAWVGRVRDYKPALADALLDAGAPVLLGLSMAGVPLQPPPWTLLAGSAAFVLLQWVNLKWLAPRLSPSGGRWVAVLLWAGLLAAAAFYRLQDLSL